MDRNRYGGYTKKYHFRLVGSDFVSLAKVDSVEHVDGMLVDPATVKNLFSTCSFHELHCNTHN